jgi:hypothetical protein
MSNAIQNVMILAVCECKFFLHFICPASCGESKEGEQETTMWSSGQTPHSPVCGYLDPDNQGWIKCLQGPKL